MSEVVVVRKPSSALRVKLPDRRARCGVCSAVVGEFDSGGKLILLPDYSLLRPPTYSQAHYGMSKHKRHRAEMIEAKRRGANVHIPPERPHSPVVVDLRDAERRWPLECARCHSWNSVIPQVKPAKVRR